MDPASITTIEALASLPVIRKADLVAAQKTHPPLGGFLPEGGAFEHIFQSPGPIYEIGRTTPDWWRMGRFLHACGVGPADIVQNCFGYHLTPAGMIFESGARAVGARVLPAGTGQTDLQVRAAADVGSTAYAGTPDYLKVILDRAEGDGRAAGHRPRRGGRRRPLSLAAQGLCRSRHPLPAMLCHGRSRQHRLRERGDGGDDPRRRRAGRDRAPRHRRSGARRRGGRGGGHHAQPRLSPRPLRHGRPLRPDAGPEPLRPHQPAHPRLDGARRPDHQDQGHVRAPRTGGRSRRPPLRGQPRPSHRHPRGRDGCDDGPDRKPRHQSGRLRGLGAGRAEAAWPDRDRDARHPAQRRQG